VFGYKKQTKKLRLSGKGLTFTFTSNECEKKMFYSKLNSLLYNVEWTVSCPWACRTKKKEEKLNTNIDMLTTDKPWWQTVQTLLWGKDYTHMWAHCLSWFYSPLIDLHSIAWLRAY